MNQDKKRSAFNLKNVTIGVLMLGLIAFSVHNFLKARSERQFENKRAAELAQKSAETKPVEEELVPLVPVKNRKSSKLPAPPSIKGKRDSKADKKQKTKTQAQIAPVSPTAADQDTILVNVPTPKRVDFKKCTLKNAAVKGNSVTWNCEVLVDYR